MRKDEPKAVSSRPPTSTWMSRLQARLRRDAATFGQRFAVRGGGQGPADDRDRRGMVLVMTMLMTTILALLGSAATTSTASQLRESSATRLEHIALRVGEAATMASVSLAGQMQSQFEEYVAGRGYKLQLSDTPGLYDYKSQGSFGRELDTLAVPTFSVDVSQPRVAYGAAGYDAARYCFRSYAMRTTASVGEPKSSDPAKAGQSGQIGFQATVTVGPVPCGG